MNDGKRQSREIDVATALMCCWMDQQGTDTAKGAFEARNAEEWGKVGFTIFAKGGRGYRVIVEEMKPEEEED